MSASPSLWLASLVSLAIGCLLMSPSAKTTAFTPMGYAVVLLAAWILATNKWVNPSYTAAAPYHAAFLFGGFFLGRRVDAQNGRQLFGAALAFAVCLAGWALWQRAYGEARAHALFETPATLSAVLNLVLLPGLVLASLGRRRPLLIVATTILIAALAAATSRGGWLAFTVAGLAAAVFARRFGFRVDRRAVAVLAGSIAAGLALSSLVPAILDWTQLAGAIRQEHSMLSDGAVNSSIDRLGMYELAWHSLTPSSLFTGIGYLGFYYVMEAGRQAIPNITPGITYFVHNDYLQTLLELGVFGCAALLALVVLPLIEAWRAAPRITGDREKSLLLVALVASLTSMAIHALVDFPFYIPICLLIYGTVLGMLDAVLRQPAPAGMEHGQRFGFLPLRRMAVTAGAAFVAWTLITPVVAETAASFAHRQWRAARGESTAYWFEVARRLEPRDWRYHWYAGQFWFFQAAQNRNPEAARLADRAFEDGYAENPREIRNLLGRITTHRELSALLSAPADGVTLLDWAERAVELAPNERGAQLERALVLKQFGSAGEQKK